LTAKYNVGSDDATQWTADRQYVLAEWTTKPFVGVRHRHETVEHRLVIEYTHGVGVDICHEARSDDTEKLPSDWAAVETIEVRDYGARHDRHERRRWLD